MRTSARWSWLPPTRRIVLSWIRRSSLTWRLGGSSPISSRKSVPPSAVSTRPGLFATAPVKAPRTCPNSSDSSRFSGIAPQFTAMNGLSLRSERSWIARATSSLPVPLSPLTSTLVRVVATWAIRSCTRASAALEPTRVFERERSAVRRRWFSSTSSFFSSAFSTTSRSSSTLKGLVM
jgi:hypothetical protein